MHRLRSIALSLVTALIACSGLYAQTGIDYPYNPDSDSDSLIGVLDLTAMLAVFGDDFSPEPIAVDGVDLFELLSTMQATIEALQLQVAALEAQVEPQWAEHLVWVDSTSTFQLHGANFQITNGTTSNYPNGLGNLVLGLNNTEGMNDTIGRTGSHNLVIGDGHAYAKSNGIVHGYRSTLNGESSAVIGGQQNHIDAPRAVIASGALHHISWNSGESIIAGGESNRTLQSYASIIGGQNNEIGTDSTDTRFSVIAGGRFNEVQSSYCGIISGGYGNSLEMDTTGTGPQGRSVVGGLFNRNKGSICASIVGGWGNELNQRVGQAGQADLSIGTDSFIGTIYGNNALNTRVTGALEEE